MNKRDVAHPPELPRIDSITRLEDDRYRLACMAVDLAQMTFGEGMARDLPLHLRDRAQEMATIAYHQLMRIVTLFDGARYPASA
jgi:hypothetical protein